MILHYIMILIIHLLPFTQYCLLYLCCCASLLH